MSPWVALLRGINVGKTKTVKMEDLAALYESLGLKNVRTYLRSGNVIFDAPEMDTEKLSLILEERITGTVGFPVKVLIRTGEELQQVINDNPFLPGLSRDITRLHVTFLSDYPTPASLHMVNAIKDEADSVVATGREVYLFCPDGYGRTRFSNAFFEKNLGMVATTRNWKTVIALAEMVQDSAA